MSSAGVDEKNLKCVCELTSFCAEAVNDVVEKTTEAIIERKAIFFMFKNLMIYNYYLFDTMPLFSMMTFSYMSKSSSKEAPDRMTPLMVIWSPILI